MEQTNKWKKCLQWPHTAWLFCFFIFKCVYLSFCFHAVIWCKTWRAPFCNRRICLRGGKVGAFGIWLKRFVPCTFQLRPAWRRGPSPVEGGGEKGRRGRRGQRSTVTTRREPFWRSAPRPLTLKRVFRPEFGALNWRLPDFPGSNPMEFNPLW